MVAQSEDWRTLEANPEVEPGCGTSRNVSDVWDPAVVRPVPAKKCREGGNSIINDVRLKRKLLMTKR